ncbi:hypothetical protein CBR_g12445 [Chara braunii]|uniref:DDE Tnp4 domain-containing protein n=1 Tax=Chara braunii TaxID=69332 RepID=A0A388JSC2_CHABU|nr:hypothetical protein CBR_g12445 [Chara braunii]|eukprot:GBG60708.1 hypothetical protein CBR_g12445 [Chara braunii]
MDVRGGGPELREEEREAVAMAVTVLVLNSVGNMSSTESQKRSQLRKHRALLQRVVEVSDCMATSEAVLELCVTLYSGVFPRETPRWWIKRRTGGTWKDLWLYDDATKDYFRDKLRISRVVFMQIVVSCAAHVEKKVTHYRMPLPAEEAYPESIKWPVGRRAPESLTASAQSTANTCTMYIDKPASSPSDNYYDREQKFSIQAEVVVDLDLLILDIHGGYPGSVHEIRVLQNSYLWRRAESGELLDAPPENLPHGVVT